MLTPQNWCSVRRLVQSFGFYTEGALLSDPETVDLAGGFSAGLEALRTKESEHAAAVRALAHAQASAVEKASVLRASLKSLAHLCLSRFGSVEDPRYRLYFRDGTAWIRRARPEVLRERTTTITAWLTEEEDEVVAAQAGPLTEALNVFQAALDAIGTARSARLEAMGRLDTAKETFVAVIRALHGTLSERFPRDPDRVESKFRRSKRRQALPEETEEETQGSDAGDGSGAR